MSVHEAFTIVKTRELDIKMAAPNGVTRETAHVEVFAHASFSAAFPAEFALVSITLLESIAAELSDLRKQHGAVPTETRRGVE